MFIIITGEVHGGDGQRIEVIAPRSLSLDPWQMHFRRLPRIASTAIYVVPTDEQTGKAVNAALSNLF